MGDQSTQRKAHRFFSERMATLGPFTKQDLMDASGWSRSSVDTYWSKQFRGLIEVYVVKPIRTTAAASQERLPAVVPRGAASSDALSVVLVTFAA